MFGQSLLSAFGIACTTDTDQLFTTDVQTTSVATYQLNNATTSIPNNTYPATASSGISYTAGKFGNCAAMNNGFITVPSTATTPVDFSSKNFTISLWIKLDQASGEIICSKWSTGAANQRAIFLYITTSAKFQVYENSGSGTTNMLSTATISTGQWYHLVYSRNPTTGFIYIDGQLDTKQTLTNSINAAGTQNFYFGRVEGSGGNDFKGDIDQARIFDTALPQSAITVLYNETTTTAQSASIDYVDANPNSVAYYKMSDATDQLGNYNGTATNVNFNTEGKFGFAGAFNGSSSYISTSNPLSTGNVAYSISAWIYLNTSSHTGGIYTIWDGGANVGTYLFFKVEGGKISIGNYGGSVTSANTLAVNQWVHVAVTRDTSNNVVLYVNGSSDTTGTLTLNLSNNNPKIGALNTSVQNFNGKIDQVRIYDSALSAANVSTLYKEVECEPAAINALDQFNTVLYTGNDTNTSYTRNITGVGFQPDLVWIKSRDTTGFEHALFDSVRGAGASKILSSDTSGAQGWTSAAPMSAFITDGFSIQPRSPWNSNNLINKNGDDYVAWNWKAPLANLSTSFNGSSSSISTNVIPLSGTSFSISSWVYRNTNNTVSVIFGQSDQSNGTPFLSIGFDANNNLELLNRNASSTGLDLYLNSTTHGVGINAWYNIVWTCSATESKLYVNGVLKDTTSFTANNYSFSSQYIGARMRTTGVTNNWNGELDQVRIFDNALSSSEVTTLYEEPAASNNTLNYPAGAGCIAAYPLQTDAVDLSGNYSGASSNVTFGQPGYLTGDTNGTIPSTVATNVDAGFSIVKHTGNGSTGTVGHGLSNTPELIIRKDLDAATDWWVYAPVSPYYGYLNHTDAFNSANNAAYSYNQTVPTSTVFSVGNTYSGNVNNNNYIAYCFTSIPGYSKIGSYVGTGATGNVQYVGFEPAFVMVKAISTAEPWFILDNKRDPNNPRDNRLMPDSSAAESSGSVHTMDFNSNNFTLNGTVGNGTNGNGQTYIFLAIK